MKGNWKSVRLFEYALKIGSGSTPRGGNDVYLQNGNIALIRSQNIYNNQFMDDGIVYIDDDEANKLANVAVEINDILLNITGDSVARCCIAPKKYLPARVNQHVAIIRVNPNEFDYRFLHYYLVSPAMQKYMLSLACSGATRNALTKGMIENFLIPKPELAVQKEIADILSTLDDKITLLRQQNQTLEKTAQTLFTHWFVDFNFPDKNGKPYQDAGGKMAASELGRIPEGWELIPLHQHIKAEKGLSYKGDGLSDHGTPMHNLKSIYEGGGYQHSGIKYYCGDYKERHLCKAGDILVPNTEQGERHKLIGYPGRIPSYYKGINIYTHHLFKISSMKQSYLTNEYIYYLLMSYMLRKQIISYTNGTTVNMLSSEGLIQPIFPLPEENIITVFSNTISPIWKKIEANTQQIRTLTTIRDTLLPELMSGRIRITE